jgi:hypothetical protein
LILLFGMTQAELRAQPLSIGIRGGINVPDIKGGGTPQSEGYTSRLAPTVGIFLRYDLASRFALQGELMYSGQGGKRNGMQIIFAETLAGLPVPPGIGLYAEFNNETILNYLEMPVLACYSLTGNESGFNISVNAGPYVGILLNATVVTEGVSTIYLDEAGSMPLQIGGVLLPPQDFSNEADVADNLNKVNVGITGGVGFDVSSGRNQFRIDVRGAYGFIPIQADENDGTNRTGTFTMTVGYGFAL